MATHERLAMRGTALIIRRSVDDPAALDALETLAGLAVPEIVERHGPTEADVTYAPPWPAGGLDQATLAAVARTLAAAHARGVVHGAFDAACLTSAPAGVVVDGWGTGGLASDDVAALGRVLADCGVAPTLAARASSADIAARPSMAAIAAALTPPPRPAPVRRRVPVRAIAGIALAAAAVVATAGALDSRGSTREHERPEALGRPLASNQLTHEGNVVEVGGPNDVVVLGRWTCDGETPAVLREDGSVWWFPTWTSDAMRVPATASLVSLWVRATGTCDELVAVTSDRRLLTLELDEGSGGDTQAQRDLVGE